MKLQKKITGLLAAILLLTMSIASAQAKQNPQATLILEPKRTADGIDYDVYIEKASSLSTLMLSMDFTSKEKGTMTLAENDCFDISYSEWDCESGASLKAYFGRTGQKAGFSSEDKVKVAQISIPIKICEVGEVTAEITDAVCAGVLNADDSAARGAVSVPESTVKYKVRECSILNIGQSTIDILSSENRKADVIYALYDDSGRLINTYRQSVDLIQGKNEISVNSANAGNSISVMIWDSVNSMRPLADKINNQNGE